MGVGLLVSLTLPGLALLLVAVAALEQVAARRGRRSALTGNRRRALSASGLDVFSAALAPGHAVDLEQQRVRSMTREEHQDGAPPWAALDGGVVVIDPSPRT